MFIKKTLLSCHFTLHFKDLLAHVQVFSCFRVLANISVYMLQFLIFMSTWKPGTSPPTSVSGRWYQHHPAQSVSIPNLSLHHCSGSGNCTEHARGRCSL